MIARAVLCTCCTLLANLSTRSELAVPQCEPWVLKGKSSSLKLGILLHGHTPVFGFSGETMYLCLPKYVVRGRIDEILK